MKTAIRTNHLRYTAYKCLAKSQAGILLAFCWAHVRRDFLDGARSWPEWAAWMFDWVDDIRELYHLNAARREVWTAEQPLSHQSLTFRDRQSSLVTKLTQMQTRWAAQLQDKKLPHAKRKVLTSLKNHWAGLRVFVDHPAVPLDNNAAERALRNPVIGRKNYYGSGSVWSAERAALIVQGRNPDRSDGGLPPWSAQACKNAWSQWWGFSPHSKLLLEKQQLTAN